MAVDPSNSTVQIVISGATILGIIGYILHDVWTGYKSFKKETFDRLEAKRAKSECDEFRRLAERMEDKEDHR